MSQKRFGTVFMDRWDKDEPLSKWRESKNPKHTASSVKHGGGGVMAWACMAVSGTGPLYFTDDLMYDDSSRINLEGYKTTNIQENVTRSIGKCFMLHQDNDPYFVSYSSFNPICTSWLHSQRSNFVFTVTIRMEGTVYINIYIWMARFPDSLSASALLTIQCIGLKSVHRQQVGICLGMHRF